MSIELARRIKVLEAKVSEQEKQLVVMTQLLDSHLLASKPLDQEKVNATVAAITARALCPKCGVKPNHFFHVKNCRGTQEEQKNADDKRRDPGAT